MCSSWAPLICPSLACQLEFGLSGTLSLMPSFVCLSLNLRFRYSGLRVDFLGISASGDQFSTGSIPSVSWVGFADFRGGYWVGMAANIFCLDIIEHSGHVCWLSAVFSPDRFFIERGSWYGHAWSEGSGRLFTLPCFQTVGSFRTYRGSGDYSRPCRDPLS